MGDEEVEERGEERGGVCGEVEGCGGLIDRLEGLFGHVDIEAEANDDACRMGKSNGFGEDAADFFALDDEIVGPFELCGDVKRDEKFGA